MTPVLAAAVPDRPGGLAKLLAIIAQAGIDVEYMYSMFGNGNGMAYMIFRVADLERLESVLTANGISPSTAEELGIR